MTGGTAVVSIRETAQPLATVSRPSRTPCEPLAARVADVLSEAILAVTVFAVPLTLGGVLPGARFAFAAAGGILLVLAGARPFLSAAARRERPAVPAAFTWTLLALVALGFLQCLPLPGPVASVFSGGIERLRGGLVADGAPGSGSLSLAPWKGGESLAFGLAFAGVLLAAAGTPSASGRRRRVALTLVSAGAFTALVGLAQRVAGRGDSVLFVFDAPPGAHPFGPYVNRNHFAGFVAVALPMALGLAFSSWRRALDRMTGATWTEILAETSRSTLGRAAFLLLVAALLLGSILLAGSRGGLLAAACGAAPLVFAATASRGSLSRGVGLVATAAVLAAAAGLFLWVDPETLPSRFRDTASESFRLPLWKDSAALFAESPLVGVGPGAFAVVFPSRQSFGAPFQFPFAESDIVCFAVERGALGLALLLVLVLIAIVSVSKALKEMPASRRYLLLGATGGALALSVHAAYDFNGHLPGNGLILAVALGLAFSWARTAGNAGVPARVDVVRVRTDNRPEKGSS